MQPSGIEVYAALAHDFVLRRNIRVFLSHEKTRRQPSSTDLLVSFSSGSHHINLVRHLAIAFNLLLDNEPQNIRATIPCLPVFQDVKMDEMFGLVHSEHTESFGGLLVIKEEPEDQILQEVSRRTLEDNDRDPEVLAHYGIDPKLLSVSEQSGASPQNAGCGVKLTAGLSSKRKISPIILDDNSPGPSRKRTHISDEASDFVQQDTSTPLLSAPLSVRSENSSNVDKPVSNFNP